MGFKDIGINKSEFEAKTQFLFLHFSAEITEQNFILINRFLKVILGHLSNIIRKMQQNHVKKQKNNWIFIWYIFIFRSWYYLIIFDMCQIYECLEYFKYYHYIKCFSFPHKSLNSSLERVLKLKPIFTTYLVLFTYIQCILHIFYIFYITFVQQIYNKTFLFYMHRLIYWYVFIFYF